MRWMLRGRRDPGGGGNAELDARLSESWEAAAAAVAKMLDLPSGNEVLLASSRLSREEAADLRAPAGMTRRVGRRRRLVLRVAAGAAAGLAAVAVALAAAGVPGARRGGTGGPATDAAYVVKRIDSALSAAGPGDIAQMTVTTRNEVPGGPATTTATEEWSHDGQWRSVTHSSAGHPLYDEGVSASSVYTVVNYQTRTWARQPQPGGPAGAVPDSRGCEPAFAFAPLPPLPGLPGGGLAARSQPSTVATALRAAISCGTLAVVGRQPVDGIEAIELTSRPDSQTSVTIWVNPDTYLPVRVVSHPAADQQSLWQTADITWLAPTAQNLAKLTVPVPAGFRQVPLTQLVHPTLIPIGPKSK